MDGSGAALQEVTSGAGVLQQSPERAKERLWRRQAAGAAFGGRGADLEFRAGCRAALLADDDTQQTATGARPRAVAESTGSAAGGSPDQVIQCDQRSVGSQRATDIGGAGGW